MWRASVMPTSRGGNVRLANATPGRRGAAEQRSTRSRYSLNDVRNYSLRYDQDRSRQHPAGRNASSTPALLFKRRSNQDYRSLAPPRLLVQEIAVYIALHGSTSRGKSGILKESPEIVLGLVPTRRFHEICLRVEYQEGRVRTCRKF